MKFAGAQNIDDLLNKYARKLTTKERNNLPDSDFVFPEERKYPIPDKSHAQNALARVEQNGTPEEKKKVRQKVKSKFPGLIED